jgi:valyl-tRNA synthetase
MAGLYFTKKAPFSAVHIHGLVRDEHGQKMSKTKGNVIDPLEAIDEFGADAVRFALAIFASPGANIPLSRSRIRDYRAFATKLWNAARFTITQLDAGPRAESLEGRRLQLPERWILSRLHGTSAEVNRQLEAFRFDEAAQAIYSFLWHELCDGYLEMTKPVLSGREGTDEDRETVRAVLFETLRDSLALLHPFMPFVTEEIWEKLTDAPGTLIVTKYPMGRSERRDEEAERVIAALRAVVTRVRNFRSERAAGPTEPVELRIDPKSPGARVIPGLEELAPLLTTLARLSTVTFSSEARGGSQDVVEGVTLEMAFPKRAAGADRAQVAKKLADVDEEISSVGSKLRNSQFLEKAPPEIVEKMRRRLLELEKRRAALGSGL